MQSLQKFFRRNQSAQQSVQAQPKALTVLSAEQLKKVSGGLPHVGGLGTPTGVVAPTTLPSA